MSGRQRGGANITTNSRAYLALSKLHLNGGTLGLNAWMRAVSWDESSKEFQRAVIDKLMQTQCVAMDLAAYVITEGGLQTLGIPLDAPTPTQPVVASARYTPPARPLSAKFIPRMQELRPGSLDYRDVPSRIGDTRLKHGEKEVSLKSGGSTR